MVDPNVQATVGSPIEWYKIEIMRDVINVKEAMEAHTKNEAIGLPVDVGVIRARLQSLFNSLHAYLKRKWAKTDFEQVQKELFEKQDIDLKTLRRIFWDVQFRLDADNITKIDTRRSYDGTRVEAENDNFGE